MYIYVGTYIMRIMYVQDSRYAYPAVDCMVCAYIPSKSYIILYCGVNGMCPNEGEIDRSARRRVCYESFLV